mmetsp:Transcript_112462/g.350498  ORF Transcript_112462/g.350498 Transcript_112462/m.350498 type:complete len:103 (+) Transcript_112462:309-617(+)
MTLRSGSLERQPKGKANANALEFMGVPEDEWLEGEVVGMVMDRGLNVKVTAPGKSEPSVGLLALRNFADGLADTVTVGTKIKVRVLHLNPQREFLDLTMKEP